MMREQERFDPAEELWDLDRLYADLAKCKGKSLTPMERFAFEGFALWLQSQGIGCETQ